MNSIKKYFQITEKNSSIKIEVIAGVTTFLSMMYVLVVNPLVLSEAGMDQGALFTVTAISAMIGTLIMGLYAKYPVALAPGMGINAFFTYSVVLVMGYTWQEALLAVFISGLIFMVLSATGFRKKIIDIIPLPLKYATTVGIGMFITFIGLQNAGIIVGSDATLVTLGDLTSPTTFLSIIGIFIMFYFVVRKNNLAVFYGLLSTAIIGIIMQIIGFDMGVEFSGSVVSTPPSIEPIFGALFTDTEIWPLLTDFTFWVVIFSFLFVDFFDTTGALISVGVEADLMDEEGELKGSGKALMADATATTIGSVLGTSSVTTYVESLAGIKTGGRTGLTAVVVAGCFFIALFFSPLLVFFTTYVTAPALIVVGSMMFMSLGKIKFDDPIESITAFVTVMFMVLTYSISSGIAAGFIVYVFLKLFNNQREDLHPLLYGLAIFFLIYFIV